MNAPKLAEHMNMHIQVDAPDGRSDRCFDSPEVILLRFTNDTITDCCGWSREEITKRATSAICSGWLLSTTYSLVSLLSYQRGRAGNLSAHCCDLRFPVWSRNTYDITSKRLNYDVLIYVANWPTARVDAWDALLKARAIENLSYTVGVNRMGLDGNGIEYSGHSSIFSPKGELMFISEGMEAIRTVELNAHSLQAFRDKLPAHLDADDFSIEMGEFERDFLPGQHVGINAPDSTQTP